MAVDEPASTQTFLFADLAGYTALTEAHGDERAADVAEEFCRQTRALLRHGGGEEIKAIGDAVLLRVDDAMRAVDLGRRLVGELGARHGELAVRVGMHTGTAVKRGEDWFGATVNIAARIADEAEPGELLMTAATRRAAAGQLEGVNLQPRGQRQLKNVRDPVELFAIAPADGGPPGALAVDPVCRMAIQPAMAARTARHGRVTYYFCSDTCWHAFRDRPEAYVVHRSGDASVVQRAWARLSQALRQH